jgi:hypothetical protein
MQKKQNVKLLVSLSIMIVAIFMLQHNTRPTGNLGVEKTFFQLHDQQEITDVYIKNGSSENHLKYQSGRWRLNDTLLLDQSMRDVFFSVLSKVEIRKPVVESLKDSLVSFLKTYGTHATITFGDEIIKDYWVGGNQQQEVSWMMDSEQLVPFQVHIPGYQSYLAGIFAVPGNDWRSRFIFNLNFALLRSIEIEYPDTKPNLKLNYADAFFILPGINADSTKVANFLDNLAFLQADRFLDERETARQYDSLINNNLVLATIKLKEVSGNESRITFYNKLADRRYIIARTGGGTRCMFDYERIKSLFKTPEDFH